MCVQMREARVLRTGMGDPGWLENTGHGNNYVRDYAVRSHGIKSCNHVVVWHERALGVSRRSHCLKEREKERGALYSALREESGGRGLNRQRERCAPTILTHNFTKQVVKT